MLDHWLEAIDGFTEKIKRIQRKIEKTAAAIDKLDTLMIAPGIAAYSGLMVRGEIGEVERFDWANGVVSYAGLDPVVRESGDSRFKGKHLEEGVREGAVDPCPSSPLSGSYGRRRVPESFLSPD